MKEDFMYNIIYELKILIVVVYVVNDVLLNFNGVENLMK